MRDVDRQLQFYREDTKRGFEARLGSIDWALVEEAQRTGRPISADLSGRGPGAGRTPIDWRLEPLGM